MKKIKQLLTFFLCVALSIGLIESSAVTSKAATGKWTLVSQTAHIPSSYSDNNGYAYTYNYSLNSTSGAVELTAVGGLSSYADFTATYRMSCTAPASSYDAGGAVNLTMGLNVTNSTANSTGEHHPKSCFTGLWESDSTSCGAEMTFKDSNKNHNLEEPRSNTTVEGNTNVSMSVSGNMPETATDGSYMSIYFSTWGLTDNSKTTSLSYEWKYQYDASGSSSDTDISKITLAKVTGLKAQNKKGRAIYVSYKAVDNATGYQVRISTKKTMKKATTYKTTNLKGYLSTTKKGKSTKDKFKKGKTYYVQVRAYVTDSSGNVKYGKWSAKKKVKIKK